jgi:hypothetical protein
VSIINVSAVVTVCEPLVAVTVNLAVVKVGAGGVVLEPPLPPPQALMPVRASVRNSSANLARCFPLKIIAAKNKPYPSINVARIEAETRDCGSGATTTLKGTAVVAAARVSEAGTVHCRPVAPFDDAHESATMPAKPELVRERLNVAVAPS